MGTTQTLVAVLEMGAINVEYSVQCVQEARDNALGNYNRMRNHWPEPLLKKRKVSPALSLLGLSAEWRMKHNVAAERNENGCRTELWKETLPLNWMATPEQSENAGPTVKDFGEMYDIPNLHDIDGEMIEEVCRAWKPTVLDAVTMHIHSMKPEDGHGEDLVRHLEQIVVLMPVISISDMEEVSYDIHTLLMCLCKEMLEDFKMTIQGIELTESATSASLNLAW